jgi:hypothetical protein
MQTQETIQNACQYDISGEVDLSAAAAVTATRGDDMTTVKTGTGLYTVTIKGNKGFMLVELLGRDANFTQGKPTTALGVRVSTVTQTAGTNDIVITLNTMAAATNGIDTDGTAAVTVAFRVLIRHCKMGAPI